jgi:hypothetical protein
LLRASACFGAVACNAVIYIPQARCRATWNLNTSATSLFSSFDSLLDRFFVLQDLGQVDIVLRLLHDFSTPTFGGKVIPNPVYVFNIVFCIPQTAHIFSFHSCSTTETREHCKIFEIQRLFRTNSTRAAKWHKAMVTAPMATPMATNAP